MQNEIKSRTRLALIQFIFSSFFKNENLNLLKDEFDYFYKVNLNKNYDYKSSKVNYNKIFFNKLVSNYIKNIDENNLEKKIDSYINFDRPFKKWDKINQAIILATISELINTDKNKIKIVLKDYLDISINLISLKELKMINAILHKYLDEKKIL